MDTHAIALVALVVAVAALAVAGMSKRCAGSRREGYDPIPLYGDGPVRLL